MQEIIIIIINSIQHHLQVGDYSGLRESGPLKRGEEGDEDVGEDGDVDEDDHRDDGSPGGTPAPPGEIRERGSPSGFFLHGLPLDGERFSPLVLGHHGSRRGGSPSEIGSLFSLSLCLFGTVFWLFHHFF